MCIWRKRVGKGFEEQEKRQKNKSRKVNKKKVNDVTSMTSKGDVRIIDSKKKEIKWRLGGGYNQIAIQFEIFTAEEDYQMTNVIKSPRVTPAVITMKRSI